MVALVRSSQVRDSTGPLNQWPRGQRILALSRGPPDDRTAYLCSTSAGSPHLTAPCSSIYAGQSMKIVSVSIKVPRSANALCAARDGHLAASTPRQLAEQRQPMPRIAKVLCRGVHAPAHLIHPRYSRLAGGTSAEQHCQQDPHHGVGSGTLYAAGEGDICWPSRDSPEAQAWRLAHLAGYRASRSRMIPAADPVVDTGCRTPRRRPPDRHRAARTLRTSLSSAWPMMN